MTGENRPNYDVEIIRSQMRSQDVRLRTKPSAPAKLKALKKALQDFHTLETMASNIYKYQLTREPTELNRQLIAAMCNEMTHLQDFQVKLYEYGLRPAILCPAYQFLGSVFGLVSRLIGPKAVLKIGIWVETKAVKHYAELLETVDWDDQTRKVIEKDQADEDGHISRWRNMLSQIY
jgi:demethoxyubiquinone hydroxylase (CLK1/Coq7/Cat5 family)